MDDLLSQSATSLHSLAIKAALESRWEDALKLNDAIIQTDPKNVDALNRTAKAHFELGDFSQAQKFYSTVIDCDPYNPIAQKNLKILQTFKKSSDGKLANGNRKNNENGKVISISPAMFLNEPGKTKMVNLIKVAEPQKLSLAYCGMSVEMLIKNRGISISDTSGTYLGVLPDDLSYQLIRLINGGNKYEAIVKSVRINGLSILIRETFRSKKFKNQPSFLESSSKPKNEIITNYATSDGDNDSEEQETEEAIT